jgi:hypothetical protein
MMGFSPYKALFNRGLYSNMLCDCKIWAVRKVVENVNLIHQA